MSSRYCGDAIKKKRLEIGMSQQDLSEGICTQGMISQIEADNVSPRSDIAVKLFKRLNLNFNDVIDNNSYDKNVFEVIATHLQKHCYKKADESSDRVTAMLLEKPKYRGINHCFKGYSRLFVEDDAQGALAEFTECLTSYQKYIGDLYVAWASLGMGLVFKKMGLKDHALTNVKRAATKLVTLEDSKDATIESVTDIYMDVLVVCLELEEYSLLAEYADAIIDYQKGMGENSNSSQPSTIYRLAEIYELKSKAFFGLGKHVDGTFNQMIAYSMAIHEGDQPLADKIFAGNQDLFKLVKEKIVPFEGRKTLLG